MPQKYPYSNSIDTNTPLHPEFDKMAGAMPYLDFMKGVHRRLKPRGYLEIGVRFGDSLALAECDAIGIDPSPALSQKLSVNTTVETTTSDGYFSNTPSGPPFPVDLAFIDGLHTFEQTLRDFINVEQIANPSTVVVFDDIFPNHPEQAKRMRSTLAWTGDVWKIIECLSAHRPDLVLIKVDTYPTGLLLVGNLSPENRTLNDNYNTIIDSYLKNWKFDKPPSTVLKRDNSVHPSDSRIVSFLNMQRKTRQH